MYLLRGVANPREMSLQTELVNNMFEMGAGKTHEVERLVEDHRSASEIEGGGISKTEKDTERV